MSEGKSLKPILEAARRVPFNRTTAAIFHHILYQQFYFGDDKVVDGESIGYGRLAK